MISATTSTFHLHAEDSSLYPDGRVMDEIHSVAKVLLLGHGTVAAGRLPHHSPPDHADVHPDDLPYNN